MARLNRRLLVALFATWGGMALLGGATLMAGHTVSLPRPDREDPALAAMLATLRLPGGPALHVIHVLYASCKCSRRLVDHLVSSPRPANAQETVVLAFDEGDELDDRLIDRLLAARFTVRLETRSDLATRYHIQAAPLLAIADGDDELRYVGGYSLRKQDGRPQDLAIIAALERAHAASALRELPVFGCAVSAPLQAVLDPLRFRY